MIYLLWSQDINQKLLDLNSPKNFKIFFKHLQNFIHNKKLLFSENFYHNFKKNLKVNEIKKHDIRYILSDNISFALPSATTIVDAEKAINEFPKFIDDDLYIIGDKSTISKFFSKVDYVVVFSFNFLRCKTIKKIDCVDFANYSILDTKKISKNCLCNIYCRQNNR